MGSVRRGRHRVGAATLVLLAAACGGCVRKPEVRLADIRVEALTLRSLELVCLFEVANPNWFDARLDRFDWRMYAGEDEVAAGTAPQPIPTVPAGGKALVPVAARVDLARLSRAVRKHRVSEPLVYRLAGEPVFHVLGVAVPVTVEHLGLTPRIQAPRWRLRRVTLGRKVPPEVLLTFELTNPGEIALALEGLDGTLKLAGEPVVQVCSTRLTELPGRTTAELVVPVRIRPGGVLRAVLKAAADPTRLSFEGDFHFRTPVSLRRALLGRSADRPG